MDLNQRMNQLEQDINHRLSQLEQQSIQTISDVAALQRELTYLSESLHHALDGFSNRLDTLSPLDDNLSRPATPPAGSFLEAASSGDADTLLRLLEAGANVRLRNERCESALHLAAGGGHQRAVIALIGAGAAVDASGPHFRAPLHCAAAAGHAHAARRLLAAGAKPDARDSDGRTALMLAAANGHAHVASTLLSLGASPSERDKHGDTALIIAVKSRRWNVVEAMAQKGVPLDEVDKDGNSPMVHAAKIKEWGIVRLLCDKGASAKVYKGERNSPLLLASEDRAVETVIHLLQHGVVSSDVEVINALSWAKDSTIVWTFEDAIPNILGSKEGGMAMRAAARYGRVESLKLLLDAGVDINSAGFEVGNTALHCACFEGYSECVSLLLQRGAYKDAQTRKGNTPLHLSCFRNHIECVRILIEAGADISVKNYNDMTPRDAANSEDIRKLFTNLRVEED